MAFLLNLKGAAQGRGSPAARISARWNRSHLGCLHSNHTVRTCKLVRSLGTPGRGFKPINCVQAQWRKQSLHTRVPKVPRPTYSRGWKNKHRAVGTNRWRGTSNLHTHKCVQAHGPNKLRQRCSIEAQGRLRRAPEHTLWHSSYVPAVIGTT